MASDSTGITNHAPNDPSERGIHPHFPSDVQLLAQLHCGVVAVDGEGRIALVNTVAESLWTALSAVSGSLPLAPPAEGWRIATESLLARALRGKDPPATEILPAAPGEDEMRRIQVIAALVYAVVGRIVGAVAVCTVLPATPSSLIHQAEAQRGATQELLRSNNELLQFASVASHYLQEPLRKILAFGDRLRRSDGETLSDRGQASLARMLTVAVRMQALINDLLAFPRITTAPQPFVSADLAAIASGVPDDLETQIARSGGRVVGVLPTIKEGAV